MNSPLTLRNREIFQIKAFLDIKIDHSSIYQIVSQHILYSQKGPFPTENYSFGHTNPSEVKIREENQFHYLFQQSHLKYYS